MTASAQSNHFNLHLNGVGYLNRVRWVEPRRNAGRKADPFLACSVSALRGDADNPDNTYLDLRVSGHEAIEMVQRLGEDLEAKRKVFISFRVGDIYPHVYQREVKDRQTGQKTGDWETTCLIKGRLLLINSITIDGENVYRRDTEAAQPDDDVPASDGVEHPVEQEQAEASAAAPKEAASPAEEPSERQAQPQRTPERAQPAERQPQARPNERRPAYNGGYAAGRAARQGLDRAARAAA